MNTNYDKLFKLDPADNQSRAEVIRFLKSKSIALQGEIEDAVAIAYVIAGLMATDFAKQLSQDDLIDEILTIAGELEINPKNRESLRQELLQKIDLLTSE